MGLAIIITVFNKPYRNLLELCFLFGAAAMFSGKDIFYFISNQHLLGKVLYFMGRLSLPMFLLHWTVGSWLNRCVLSLEIKTLLYYTVTIILSIVLLYVNSKLLRGKRNGYISR